jgi:hypothetical protein
MAVPLVHSFRWALCAIEGFNLECEAFSISKEGPIPISGAGIYVQQGFSHVIRDMRVDRSSGICLEFNADTGGGAIVQNFEGTTRRSSSDPPGRAIYHPKTVTGVPSPKFFSDIWLSDDYWDLSDSTTILIDRFYIKNFLTSATTSSQSGTVLCHATNGRCSTGTLATPETVLRGSDNSFVGIAFAGSVRLESAQGLRLSACTWESIA